jgi:anti-sigma factor RsiW
MNCAYSREMLALFVEGDLPVSQTERARQHIGHCEKCHKYCEELQSSQSLIRTRLKPSLQVAVTPELLTTVRQTVLSQIDDAPRRFGWTWRLERALVLSFRRHAYACAGLSDPLSNVTGSNSASHNDGAAGWISQLGTCGLDTE